MATTTTPTSALTDVERRQLKMYFEQTRPLPQLLSTLRSRRVARGYAIESGEAEQRTATGRGPPAARKGAAGFQGRPPRPALLRDQAGLCSLGGAGPARTSPPRDLR